MKEGREEEMMEVKKRGGMKEGKGREGYINVGRNGVRERGMKKGRKIEEGREVEGKGKKSKEGREKEEYRKK